MIAMDGQSHLMLRSAVRRFIGVKSFLVSTRRATITSAMLRDCTNRMDSSFQQRKQGSEI